MEEFFKIFLSGERADRLRRAKKISAAARIALFLSLCVPYIVVMARGENPLPKILTIVFVCLPVLFGAIDLVASYRQSSLSYMLSEEQHEANLREYSGGALAAREKIYSTFLEVYAKNRRKTFWFEVAYRIAAGLPLICFELYYGFFERGEGARAFMTIALFTSAALTALFGALSTKRALKMQGEFYRAAEAEIQFVKKESGFQEKAIVRAEERAKAARGVNPVIEIFLKDSEEREATAALQKKRAASSILLTVGFVLLLSSFFQRETEGNDTVFGIVLSLSALLLTAGLILTVFHALKQRQIFFRNERKLTQSEGDRLRFILQRKFMKMQKVSSAVMLVILIAGAALGVGLAFLGKAFAEQRGETVDLSEQLLGCIYGCTLYACLLALIVFTVIFIVYRKKTKGEEAALRECIQKERELERNQ